MRWKNRYLALTSMLANHPRILKVRPNLSRFMLQYFQMFHVQKIGPHYILHSHLPPLNSKAYGRFIDEHLLNLNSGPTHAQIGLTNACPQNCIYCYNKDRKGSPMDSQTIASVIKELQEMGVIWIGFTGGEPLLNRDIVTLTKLASDSCSVKLFTTGVGMTGDLSRALCDAGLFSVAVSLDHWKAEEHDKIRRYPGAFQAALKALEILLNQGDIHVGVSAVVSKDMLRGNDVEEFIEFLIKLGVHEAWLSETKPSVEAFWNDDCLITEEERTRLYDLQNNYNRSKKITVNYLGHFEGRENFGCNAGLKMIYIDAFGDVSPCVFTPLTFGNVNHRPLKEIFKKMNPYFNHSNSCFINRNYRLLKNREPGRALSEDETLALIQKAEFGPPSRFFKLYLNRRS